VIIDMHVLKIKVQSLNQHVDAGLENVFILLGQSEISIVLDEDIIRGQTSDLHTALVILYD